MPVASPTTTLGYALFATRWLQAPLYFGLVAAQGVYVYKFFNELWNLILRCVTGQANETYVMLAVLKLVDVVMIANLLIMVIVGGYETFVSRIGLQGHRDQPEWLSHVNSNVLKVKLATAIVGISSVHLLQMFVDVHHTSHHSLLWGTVIHMAFIASAAILAYMSGPMADHGDRSHKGQRSGHGPGHGHGDAGGGHGSNVPAEFSTSAVATRAPVPIPAQATASYTSSYEHSSPYEKRNPSSYDGYETGAEARIRAARFPSRKQLEEFDQEHPRDFDREVLARLGKLDFVAARRNVVFVGPPGTGKTHLAVGLGVRACQAGHQVLFATAAEWAARLTDARAAGRLAEELAALDAHALLIIDEVGYTPFDADTAHLFFQLVAHRYERASVIVAGDRPLGRWDEIFGGAAPAMVDRLAHHAEIVRLEGDSYRMRRATGIHSQCIGLQAGGEANLSL
ncbi:IS21-like element helper ATPase IstB [Streptomyces sp. NBC_00878]|uniref:IS21-like element helper ATPase IstB n=1 Tax=Streptomyces sp. NBC_00878 TaxID=2975854 RepID=UPI0022560FC7|nr:IS21-like element helper ATPase IstB [Streptomyces sp. NBC_00878]MCX4906563.1 IS21-like element helper ATPase IstB [Streptomyces sp. NBC_00878]